MNKKLIGAIMTCAVVVPTAFAFTGCGEQSPKVNARDVYSFAAVSSAECLGDLAAKSAVLEGTAAAEPAKTRPAEILESDVSNMVKYIDVFEDMLRSGIDHTTSALTEQDSKYKDTYKIKMSISIPNANGVQQTYAMYFNETNTETNTELDEGDEEVEVNSTLEGVIVFNNQEFPISGERTVETEGKETEDEITFKTVSPVDETDYVEITQSIEQGEIEYEYKIYENGECISTTEIGFEEEKKGDFELSLEFKDNTKPTEQKTEYEIKQTTSTKELDTYEIEYQKDKKAHKIILKLDAEQAVFTYENGFTETIAR